MSDKKPLPLSPELAINLYENLIEARKLYLHPALSRAVKEVGVRTIDAELYQLVPLSALDRLAELGLRGELAFPIPSIIKHSPSLLGYYRMLLGQSKKEFRRKGYSIWVNAEENTKLSRQNENELAEYCGYLVQHIAVLVFAMGQFDQRDLSDLALLTPGSTFQGARNDAIGSQAEKQIFALLSQLLSSWTTYEEWPIIRFAHYNGSTFEIVNKSDPDISLSIGSGASSTPLLAIEVKGGSDASNAHNRAGEAEKSHIKAATAGYIHRWALIQIPRGQKERIMSETPSSTKVFEFNAIISQTGDDWAEFQREFLKLTQIVL